jgi:hypothetical protein
MDPPSEEVNKRGRPKDAVWSYYQEGERDSQDMRVLYALIATRNITGVRHLFLRATSPTIV